MERGHHFLPSENGTNDEDNTNVTNRFESDIDRRVSVSRTLLGCARALTQIPTPELDVTRPVEIADGLVEHIVAHGACGAHFMVPSPTGSELSLLAQRKIPTHAAAALACVSIDSTFLSATAARTRSVQTLAIEGGTSLLDQHPLARDVMAAVGAGSMISAPLVHDGKLDGVLTWLMPAETALSKEEILLVGALCEGLAAQLSRSRHAIKEKRLSETVSAVRLASLSISRYDNLETVLQNIVDQARKIAGAEYAALGVETSSGAALPFNPWVFSGMSEDQSRKIGRFPRPVGLLGAVPHEGRAI